MLTLELSRRVNQGPSNALLPSLPSLPRGLWWCQAFLLFTRLAFYSPPHFIITYPLLFIYFFLLSSLLCTKPFTYLQSIFPSLTYASSSHSALTYLPSFYPFSLHLIHLTFLLISCPILCTLLPPTYYSPGSFPPPSPVLCSPFQILCCHLC